MSLVSGSSEPAAQNPCWVKTHLEKSSEGSLLADTTGNDELIWLLCYEPQNCYKGNTYKSFSSNTVLDFKACTENIDTEFLKMQFLFELVSPLFCTDSKSTWLFPHVNVTQSIR